MGHRAQRGFVSSAWRCSCEGNFLAQHQEQYQKKGLLEMNDSEPALCGAPGLMDVGREEAQPQKKESDLTEQPSFSQDGISPPGSSAEGAEQQLKHSLHCSFYTPLPHKTGSDPFPPACSHQKLSWAKPLSSYTLLLGNYSLF